MSATVALLRAMATGSDYRDRKHDIILNAGANEIERFRAINAELLAALEKITHEHLQFAGYFEHVDHEAQLEARAAIARAKP